MATDAEYDARWTCAGCGTWYVVGILARDCEAKHEADDDATQP